MDSTNFSTFFKGKDASAGSIEGNGSGGVVLTSLLAQVTGLQQQNTALEARLVALEETAQR